MKKKMEFSKIMIIVLTIYNIIMTVWAFVLYSIGRDVPAEIVVSLVAGLFGEYGAYIARAHFGKANEEANKLTMALAEMEMKEDQDGSNEDI